MSGKTSETNSRVFNKIVAVGLTATMLVGALAGPAAADDGDKDERDGKKNQPVLVKERTAAILAGTTTWVNVLWLADGDIDNLKIEAKAEDGVTVGYSTTTGDHAGPMNGYEMLNFETDFTALAITVPEDFDEKRIKVKLKATWTRPDGEKEDKDFKLKIPVVRYEGKDWQLVEKQAPIGDGWVEIPVLGLAPTSSDLRFAPAAGETTEFYLPQGDWTGPHHDSALSAGESDVLRFYIEPSSISADLTLDFVATWSRDGQRKREAISFTVSAN